MKLIKYFFFFLILLGCYHNEKVISRELIIRKSKVFKYEVEIPILYEGRGNPHQLDASKYRFENSDWIYFNSMENRISYHDLVLTSERGKTKFPYCQSNLRGFISFKKDSIFIRLIVPQYNDGDTIPDKWNNYEYNGDYKLKKYR